jgi:hypothetical protein
VSTPTIAQVNATNRRSGGSSLGRLRWRFRNVLLSLFPLAGRAW